MKTGVKVFSVVAITALGFAIVYVLFVFSENIIHYKNNFTRRFPHHLATQARSLDLSYNSYYFAGAERGNIYLGNVTTPLRLTIIDSALQTKKIVSLQLDGNKQLLKAPHVRVSGDQFYVYEGSSGLIFSGNTNSWRATLRYKNGVRFSVLEPVDAAIVGMRYFDPESGKNMLGTANLYNAYDTYFARDLLQRTNDGIFDTDGVLRYDSTTRSFVYVHLYKNEVILSDARMKLKFRSRTIDTVSRAEIRLAKTSANVTKFAKPPLVVNKTAAVSQGLLFVNSKLAGQFEQDYMWKTTSIIDVYDLSTGAYRSSFYIDDANHKKLDAFVVSGRHLYALIGNLLVDYSLKKNLTAESK